MKPQILAVIGSLRASSSTHRAIEVVSVLLKKQGAAVELIDLKDTPLPLFNPDQKQSEAWHACQEKVLRAQAIVLGTPDYHGCMSGALKNFLDYFWQEFAGKLFGYICSSHEKGLTAIDEMRTVVRQCYGWSLPYGVGISDHDFDKNTGAITSTTTQKKLEMLAYDLTTYAPLLSQQFYQDRDSPDFRGFASHYRPRNG